MIDWGQQPYGEMSDAALGRLLGVTRHTVRTHRLKRGIAAFKPEPKPARPTMEQIRAQRDRQEQGAMDAYLVYFETNGIRPSRYDMAAATGQTPYYAVELLRRAAVKLGRGSFKLRPDVKTGDKPGPSASRQGFLRAVVATARALKLAGRKPTTRAITDTLGPEGRTLLPVQRAIHALKKSGQWPADLA